MKPHFMNPLSWFPRKEMPAGIILPSDVGRTPVSLDKAEAQAREGYGKSWVVYRCVNLISGSASSVPWDLFEKMPNGERGDRIASHPLLDLLAKPNPLEDTGEEFWFANYAYKQLNGNAFLRVCQGPREGAGQQQGPPPVRGSDPRQDVQPAE